MYIQDENQTTKEATGASAWRRQWHMMPELQQTLISQPLSAEVLLSCNQ